MSCCDGFRLAAASECSLRSKARIDALFEDSRSVCSSFVGLPAPVAAATTTTTTSATTSAADEGCYCSADEELQRRVNSAVQARIEAMFASVEAESAAPGECAAALLPVKYMGAAPVGGRVASVRGLQEPLRQLVERIRDAVEAELEVSRRGLTFRTSELHEKNNPFRRISVWSALKLRARKRRATSDSYEEQQQHVVHAFVPLVADERAYGPPSSSSRENAEDRHAELYRTMRGLARDVDEYPPIFAVVMRRPGAARLLECHAFACRSEEDAIAAAATLYRALLADLDATTRRPRQTRDGLGCASLASLASNSVIGDHCSNGLGNNGGDEPPLPPIQPVRPPRAKRNSTSSGANTEDEHGCPANSYVVDGSNASALHRNRSNGNSRNNRNADLDDVLEARSRRFCSPPKSAKSSDRSNSDSSRAEQAQQVLVEKRMNAINKSHGSRSAPSLCQAISGEVQVIETIYDEQQQQQQQQQQQRAVAEISSKSERKSPYDLECCTENSLYESSLAAIGQWGGAPCIAAMTASSTSGSNGNDYAVKRQPQQKQRWSDAAGARHREHVRDSDKMTREPASSKSCRSSTKRLARVATMDRPLRRTLEAQQQSKQQPAPQARRRRSRAGSEPPKTPRVDSRAAALLKRSQSDVDLDRGDLLTRVELPRRSSFLKQPGSVRKRDGREGGGAGTPLGFTELFDEFRNQEGLTSVDDILAAIIDPEGMSFNELKPLYKEFLLKLAATLTQDELYQRSASIMRRRRRRPQRRRSSRGLLRRAIKRSVSRLRSNAGGHSAPIEFTSVVFPARRLGERASLGSSTSCDAGAHRRRSKARNLSSNNNSSSGSSSIVLVKTRRRSTAAAKTTCASANPTTTTTTTKKGGRAIGGQATSTATEDSDTCRRIVAANRSSSGYVSCSECSYDSESCTCVSADKCYCSLSRRTTREQEARTTAAASHPSSHPSAAPLVCSCDTDSCSESNKCYCARKQQQQQPSILEQLRQKGILVPSESTISRGESPEGQRSARAGLASSKSLEYLQVRSPRGSTDNLALDYELFRPGGRRRSSRCSSGSERKVLVVSARDPRGRLVYVGDDDEDEDEDDGGDGRRASRQGRQTMTNKRHHEALSIKKSAEIAAVFGVAGSHGHRVNRRTSSASSLRSSVSLEAGLGYLP